MVVRTHLHVYVVLYSVCMRWKTQKFEPLLVYNSVIFLLLRRCGSVAARKARPRYGGIGVKPQAREDMSF